MNTNKSFILFSFRLILKVRKEKVEEEQVNIVSGTLLFTSNEINLILSQIFVHEHYNELNKRTI